MKKHDMEELRKPYDEATSIDDRFAVALGMDCSAIRILFDEIFRDLDEQGYGIGWWAPHPGTSRRILISDYLLQCVESIRTNLIEARLHLMEASDWQEQESDFLANAVKMDQNGMLSVRLPPRKAAVDDLPGCMAQLHRVGFFRAIAGAFDCLGAAIVGVGALPIRILKADLAQARSALRQVPNPSTHGQRIQVHFARELERQIEVAGPHGWLTWTTDFRNMVVHRGRRLQINQLLPRGLPGSGGDGLPLVGVRAVPQLPQEPDRSDVEMLRDTSNPPVLTEDAEQTLNGIFDSALRLVTGITAELTNIWKTRRGQPDLLHQPRQQWPNGCSTKATEFSGYTRGSVIYDPTQFRVSARTFRRMKSAAVHDDVRQNWDSFD